MGQITIEIPQSINRKYRFVSENSAKKVLLKRVYSKSHNLMLGGAIIAATCLENDLTLVTSNIKDFRFIKGLKILKP